MSCRSNKDTCSICSGTHETKTCPIKETHIESKNAQCPNCDGPHTAAYRGCPKYKQEQEIKKVQITGKISYAEAVRRHKNQGADKPQAPPGNESEKIAHDQTEKANQSRRPPSTECPNKVAIGTNTEEIHKPVNQDETKENDNTIKNLVNKYIHATLRVMNAADTKEDMIKKICIILKRLMATMENTRSESEMNRQAEGVTQEGNKINHG